MSLRLPCAVLLAVLCGSCSAIGGGACDKAERKLARCYKPDPISRCPASSLCSDDTENSCADDEHARCAADCVNDFSCEEIRSPPGCYRRCSEENCLYQTGTALWAACMSSPAAVACLEDAGCADAPPDDGMLTNVSPLDGAYTQCIWDCSQYLEGDD